MAAAGFGWTTLEFSRERRAWLRAAGATSLALATALASGLAAEASTVSTLKISCVMRSSAICMSASVSSARSQPLPSAIATSVPVT